jgi:hypothetical protein
MDFVSVLAHDRRLVYEELQLHMGVVSCQVPKMIAPWHRLRPEPVTGSSLGYRLPEPDYDGERLIRCDANIGQDSGGSLAPMSQALLHAPGASGGGWITGSGYLNSLTSYVCCAR